VNAGRNYLGDGETISASATYARKLGQDGFIDFGVNWKNSQAASRAIPSQAKYIYPALPGGAADPRDASVDRYFWGQSYGPGEEDVIATSVNAELPVSDDVTLYAFGTLSHRSSKKNTGSFLPNNITRPNTTTSLPEVYPLGFNALRRIFQLDTQVAFGARGERGDWRWDLSTTLAHDNAQLDGQNTINATLGPASDDELRRRP
jgi:iron complex outermembrane receptor protein